MATIDLINKSLDDKDALNKIYAVAFKEYNFDIIEYIHKNNTLDLDDIPNIHEYIIDQEYTDILINNVNHAEIFDHIMDNIRLFKPDRSKILNTNLHAFCNRLIMKFNDDNANYAADLHCNESVKKYILSIKDYPGKIESVFSCAAQSMNEEIVKFIIENNILNAISASHMRAIHLHEEVALIIFPKDTIIVKFDIYVAQFLRINYNIFHIIIQSAAFNEYLDKEHSIFLVEHFIKKSVHSDFIIYMIKKYNIICDNETYELAKKHKRRNLVEYLDRIRPEITPATTYEAKNCGICLEDFALNSLIKTVKCGHTFHENCIRKWREKSSTCPIDRKKI